MVAVTLFDDIRSPKGKRVELTWDKFIQSLRYPTREVASKEALPGWSAASFVDNYRSSDHVYSVSAVVLDYDDGSTTFDRAVKFWSVGMGAIHTSYSHIPECHRLRVILALSRPVSPEEYEIIWDCVAQHARGGGHNIDQVTHDPGRFWYAPCKSVGFRSERFRGKVIDVAKVLRLHKYIPEAPDAAPIRALDESEKQAAVLLASRYISAIPGAIAGNGGHVQTLKAACALVRGFCLDADTAVELLENSYNPRCDPPWSERELKHKVKCAFKYERKPWGYLLGRSHETGA